MFSLLITLLLQRNVPEGSQGIAYPLAQTLSVAFFILNWAKGGFPSIAEITQRHFYNRNLAPRKWLQVSLD